MNHSGKAADTILARIIGTIRTPFKEASGTPIQSAYARDVEGMLWVDDSFAAALDDIEEFERIWLIYWMDRTGPFRPIVLPYRDNKEHGLFATRSPNRPNPIGMSVVRLLRREGSRLFIADVDMLDNTPLLDIKPYVPEFDACPASRAGWFDRAGVDRRVADGRFHGPGPDTGNGGS
jgi:tRNA-Thr(GGU) m(6)t(6)A37 methyltransferase TsaA